MKPSVPLRISASGVRLFRECPFRYALDYVDRLPQDQRLPSPAMELGNAVHKTLAQFILQDGWRANTLDDFIAMLMDHWKGRPEADDDFADFMYAKEMLTSFYQAPYPKGDAHRELGVERGVSWKKGHRGIVATGKLDRVCHHAEGTLEVIDYKTGRKMQDYSEVQDDLQAIFYRTLAADAFRELSPQRIRITFLYLSTGIPVSIEFCKEDFQTRWLEVEVTASQLRDAFLRKQGGIPLWESFPLKRGVQCLNCLVRGFCQRRFGGAIDKVG